MEKYLNKEFLLSNKEKILEALAFAEKAHDGQMRKSGEPYIIHPVATAVILIDMGMDTETIIAALLHDVVEDTEVELSEVSQKFGEDVAALVDGVTKLGLLPLASREVWRQHCQYQKNNNFFMFFAFFTKFIL